jgi:UDP-3-O-[3-hydroxymyristoyl] glucosamine N-acyltransferase
MAEDSKGKTVSELARFVGGHATGDINLLIDHVASLENANQGAIAFIENTKLLDKTSNSNASCIIIQTGSSACDAQSIIEVEQPKLAFALIAQLLHPPKKLNPSIHPTAIIESTTTIDAGTQVHNNVSIGNNVKIGKNCVIHPNVTIYNNVTIGDNVIIHAGVVIGADGFGYVRSATGYIKFPQIGTVVIEDDVEIGANSCIDRGALGATRIGQGTKIDNLVQIAHNVEIGKRVVIASQTGISGSTIIEDDAVIGGQVGMGDHARVQSGAVIGSKAGVLPGKIVRAGSVMWGVPVRPLEEYKRLNAYFGRLPQMHNEINELRQLLQKALAKIEEMEKR